jgi:hypothetical protein
MADLDQQTEEALGWAAEGKKLAVDIPEVSFKDAATFVAEMTPIVGDVMAAKEVYDELQKDEPNYYLAGALGGAALVGLVPGLGDVAAKAIKKGAREVFDVAKRVEVDPNAMGSGLGNVRLKSKDTDNAIKPPRNTGAVVDPVLEADDIIVEWEKGNMSNTELRSLMRDKGFEIQTKRIGPKTTGGELEVLDPRTGMIDTWDNFPTSLNDDVAEAAAILESDEALSAWQQANKIPENKRQANTEAAKAAAEDLYQGNITSKEARAIIKEDLPITSMYTAETMPSMPTVAQVAGSLGKKVQKTGVVGVKGFDIPAGTRVGSRLDIPAYNNYDTWVVSIHDGKNDAKGSVLGYGQAVRLKNIKFGSESQDALDIARGKARLRGAKAGTDTPEKPMGKATIARVYGDYIPEDPYTLQEQARNLLSDPEWTQVGMNPYRQSNFYDKNTGLPVFEADEVIQVGPLVLAKGVKKPTKTQLKQLAVRTKDGKLRLFNEGGAVMDQQMEMAFGGAVERVDPVSGNEVPTGSLPEEVRDDIPAQLSEGEYVVPADVVRFFGVKFFEDLRTEAKIGFNSMEANGRIGGEPIGETGMEMGGDELPFDISELQIIDDGEPEQPMMNRGGFISGYAPGGLVDTGDLPLTEENYQGTGMEQRQYSNAEGNIITILFFNGMPMSAVPDGYSSYTPDAVPSEAKAVSDSGDDGVFASGATDPEPIDYKGLSAAELRDLVDAQKDTSSTAISLGLGMLNPLLGMAFKAATWHQSKQITKELERRMADPSLDAKQKAFYTDLTETMTADQPGLFERLFGKTEEAKKPEVAATVAPPVMSPAEVEAAMTYTPDVGYVPAATAAETAEVKAANEQIKIDEAVRTSLDVAKKGQQKRQRAADEAGAKASAAGSMYRDKTEDPFKDTAQRAEEAAERNKSDGLGAQTKKGSTAGSKSDYFD